MKKLDHALNIIIGTFIGIFIGRGLYVYHDFRTRPEIYEIQSAPWYTGILLFGAFSFTVILICIAIKLFIRIHRSR